MVARVRYDDPQVVISETSAGYVIRIIVSREAMTNHLAALEATVRGLEALLMLYNDPLEPPP